MQELLNAGTQERLTHSVAMKGELPAAGSLAWNEAGVWISMAGEPKNCVAFVSPKGGVGKSTSALILAQVAARSGKRVLLVDADPQASLIKWSVRASANDRLQHELEVEPVSTPAELEHLYHQQDDTRDLLIFDLPGAQSSLLSVGGVLSDLIITPGSPTGADLAGIGLAKQLIDKFAAIVDEAPPPMYWLLTKFDHVQFGRTNAATPEGRRSVMAKYGIGAFETFLTNRKAFHTIDSLGETLWGLLDEARKQKKATDSIAAAIEQAEAFGRETFMLLDRDANNG